MRGYANGGRSGGADSCKPLFTEENSKKCHSKTCTLCNKWSLEEVENPKESVIECGVEFTEPIHMYIDNEGRDEHHQVG